MTSDMHLLVVAPHPDDETLALGGTIHDHLRCGGSCEVVAVTDGEAADDTAGPAERWALGRRRAQERRESLRSLGASMVRVTRLGLPDREVAREQRRLEDELGELFDSVGHNRLVVVALPWRGDGHVDHQATWRAGVRAARGTRLKIVETPIWARYDGAFGGEDVVRLPVSQRGRAAKRAALRCFKSQLELLPGGRGPVLPPGFLEAFDGPDEPVIV